MGFLKRRGERKKFLIPSVNTTANTTAEGAPSILNSDKEDVIDDYSDINGDNFSMSKKDDTKLSLTPRPRPRRNVDATLPLVNYYTSQIRQLGSNYDFSALLLRSDTEQKYQDVNQKITNYLADRQDFASRNMYRFDDPTNWWDTGTRKPNFYWAMPVAREYARNWEKREKENIANSAKQKFGELGQNYENDVQVLNNHLNNVMYPELRGHWIMPENTGLGEDEGGTPSFMLHGPRGYGLEVTAKAPTTFNRRTGAPVSGNHSFDMQTRMFENMRTELNKDFEEGAISEEDYKKAISLIDEARADNMKRRIHYGTLEAADALLYAGFAIEGLAGAALGSAALGATALLSDAPTMLRGVGGLAKGVGKIGMRFFNPSYKFLRLMPKAGNFRQMARILSHVKPNSSLNTWRKIGMNASRGLFDAGSSVSRFATNNANMLRWGTDAFYAGTGAHNLYNKYQNGTFGDNKFSDAVDISMIALPGARLAWKGIRAGMHSGRPFWNYLFNPSKDLGTGRSIFVREGSFSPTTPWSSRFLNYGKNAGLMGLGAFYAHDMSSLISGNEDTEASDKQTK